MIRLSSIRIHGELRWLFDFQATTGTIQAHFRPVHFQRRPHNRSSCYLTLRSHCRCHPSIRARRVVWSSSRCRTPRSLCRCHLSTRARRVSRPPPHRLDPHSRYRNPRSRCRSHLSTRVGQVVSRPPPCCRLRRYPLS